MKCCSYERIAIPPDRLVHVQIEHLVLLVCASLDVLTPVYSVHFTLVKVVGVIGMSRS